MPSQPTRRSPSAVDPSAKVARTRSPTRSAPVSRAPSRICAPRATASSRRARYRSERVPFAAVSHQRHVLGQAKLGDAEMAAVRRVFTGDARTAALRRREQHRLHPAVIELVVEGHVLLHEVGTRVDARGPQAVVATTARRQYEADQNGTREHGRASQHRADATKTRAKTGPCAPPVSGGFRRNACTQAQVSPRLANTHINNVERRLGLNAPPHLANSCPSSSPCGTLSYIHLP